ncbi:MAG: hypothetical protein IJ764_02420, partial [Bacteroidales bacterium]|nr:hypothetical protein [Bacteroidales bacterium]
VSKGKRKIIAYYEAQSSTIIATARSLAAQHQYEEAFYLLAGIPSECSSAYGKALTAGNEIFAQYTDYCCQINLAKARTLWAAEQNSSGAAKAGEYLSTIYPEAACYGEAEALYQEIKGKVLDDWHFEMKRYQDGIDLERARIDAWRQVGIAYGNHQQPVDYNVNWLVR